MKWAALALLAFNLVLAAWGWMVRSEARQPAQHSVIPNVSFELLGEVSYEQRQQLARTASPLPSEPPDDVADFVSSVDAVSNTGCLVLSVGVGRIAELYQRVSAQADAAFIGELQEQRPGAVMVYVPPFLSPGEAEIELRGLRAAGIDGFVIPDGDLANGISVGVFNTEANVQRRMEQLQGMGYSVDRYQYQVERTSYAINIPLAESVSTPWWNLTELEADFPGLEVHENSCWKVASTSNFN